MTFTFKNKIYAAVIVAAAIFLATILGSAWSNHKIAKLEHVVNIAKQNAEASDRISKVKDSFRIDIASVTGTPLHYLMPQMKGQPSGESLKKAETRFLAKVRDRQESFGQTWADIMEFALLIEGRGGDIRLHTNWEDPAPMSDREVLENILIKKNIGISVEQALSEAGYGEVDIRTMLVG